MLSLNKKRRTVEPQTEYSLVCRISAASAAWHYNTAGGKLEEKIIEEGGMRDNR